MQKFDKYSTASKIDAQPDTNWYHFSDILLNVLKLAHPEILPWDNHLPKYF